MNQAEHTEVKEYPIGRQVSNGVDHLRGAALRMIDDWLKKAIRNIVETDGRGELELSLVLDDDRDLGVDGLYVAIGSTTTLSRGKTRYRARLEKGQLLLPEFEPEGR